MSEKSSSALTVSQTQPSSSADAPPATEFATLASMAPTTPTSESPGSPTPRFLLPGYEMLAEIGRGGMGVVYKARQTGLDRLVAIKTILHAEHASADALQRFRTEAEAVARLQHPHILQIFDIGTHDGLPYCSLEYCPRGSLSAMLDGTPLPARDAASLIEKLAHAVHAAHEARIIHRDLKPSNILLSQDGEPKLADFGLAKRLDQPGETQTGAVLGTPSYMAPEQATGKKDIGPGADIYALGAILYQLLTGRPPFKAATTVETIQQVIREEPAPPRQLNSRIPADLETICRKCLNKDPLKRYASAQTLADDLRRFLDGKPILARPTGNIERFVRWVRRNPVTASLSGTIAALLVVGIAASSYFAVQAHASAQLAHKLLQEKEAAIAREREVNARVVQFIRRHPKMAAAFSGRDLMNRFLEANPDLQTEFLNSGPPGMKGGVSLSPKMFGD